MLRQEVARYEVDGSVARNPVCAQRQPRPQLVDSAGHCYWHQRGYCYDGAYRRHQVFAGQFSGPQSVAHGHDLRVARSRGHAARS